VPVLPDTGKEHVMRSAIRLIACVVQVGAFAPAWAGTGESRELDASGEHSTSTEMREESTASAGAETASGPESGIGTAMPEESGFRRTASDAPAMTRSDAEDRAMMHDEDERARRQAEVEEIWTRH
jgi:hypothetical protein